MKEIIHLFFLLFLIHPSSPWGTYDDDKVLLRDIKALTLKQGKMTKGRRSSPVPQLECVSSGSIYSSLHPKVVQCINVGHDGSDVQWECKADLDSSVRFGEIEVTCEGFDYPNDDYVLKGSCGLRYTLEYTNSGYHQSNYKYDDSYVPRSKKFSILSNFADLIVYLGLGLMIYALYRTCISGRDYDGQTAYSSTDEDYPSGGGGGGGYGWFGGQNPPHSSSHRYNDDASCGSRYRGNRGWGGFWTGAATGGLLGYMFGNRGQPGYYGNSYGGSMFGGRTYGYTPREPTYQSSGGFGGGHSSSSGTRSASGFGGTSRR